MKTRPNGSSDNRVPGSFTAPPQTESDEAVRIRAYNRVRAYRK